MAFADAYVAWAGSEAGSSTEDLTQPNVTELLATLRQRIFYRRLRAKEFFCGFDPLHSGRCTKNQFTRAVKHLHPAMGYQEAHILADHFTDESLSKARWPHVVNYRRFCESLENVFGNRSLEKNPSAKVAPPGSDFTCSISNPLGLAGDQSKKVTGIPVQTGGQDIRERKRPASATTPSRLHRKPSDVEIPRPATAGATEGFLCEGFKAAIQERPSPSRPTSAFVKLDSAEAKGGVSETTWARRPATACPSRSRRTDAIPRVDAVTRVKTAVAERRLHIAGYFQDFDKLRRGTCTASHLSAVLTVVGVTLSVEDFASMFSRFRTHDNKFRYRDFCAEVSGPTAGRVLRFAAAARTPLRFKVPLDEHQQVRLKEFQTVMAAKVRLRGMEVRSIFEDFNRQSSTAIPAHITVSQFRRAMATLGWTLTDDQFDLLCQAYVDTEDGQNFNYIDFLEAIDPDPVVFPARPEPSSQVCDYFDSQGRVKPRVRPQSAPVSRSRSVPILH